MRNASTIFLVFAGLAFVLAVYSATLGSGFLSLPAESYSRAADTLALFAIAVLLRERKP